MRVTALVLARLAVYVLWYQEMQRSRVSLMIPKKGRPPVETVAIMVRVPADMMAAIDKLRRAEEDPPTRPEMIRRLVANSLKP